LHTVRSHSSSASTLQQTATDCNTTHMHPMRSHSSSASTLQQIATDCNTTHMHPMRSHSSSASTSTEGRQCATPFSCPLDCVCMCVRMHVCVRVFGVFVCVHVLVFSVCMSICVSAFLRVLGTQGVTPFSRPFDCACRRVVARGFCPAAAARHPKFGILIRRFCALYCVFGSPTGCSNPCFQVLALFWILPLSTPKNTFSCFFALISSHGHTGKTPQ